MGLISEQNCLDIARAYGDIRISDLVQAKFDSLPKSKEGKGKGGGKPVAKLASLAGPKVNNYLVVGLCYFLTMVTTIHILQTSFMCLVYTLSGQNIKNICSLHDID
jgi:hypothetical protein